MNKESIVTPAGQFSYDRLHFSEAVKSSGFLFCSGIIGSDEKGRVPADMTEEFELAWTKVLSLLAEVGATADDIVECTTYHIGMADHLTQFSAVRDKYVKEPWPAWTAIGISELAIPGAHVEIRVTAKTA